MSELTDCPAPPVFGAPPDGPFAAMS